jgi:hypothetical protein
VDAGSFMVAEGGVVLQSVRVLQAQGPLVALRRAVGRDIDFMVTARDTFYFVRGRVLSAQPLAVRVANRVLYQMPGQPAFPDSLVQLAPRAELNVLGSAGVRTLNVSYLTAGLRWRSTLNVTVPRVGGGVATVAGIAVIDNEGLTVRNAEVQLASGEIRRVRPRPDMARMNRMEEAGAGVIALRSGFAAAMPEEEAVAEMRVYELPQRMDLEPGVTTTAALFTPATADVQRLFVIDPSNQVADQWGERADSNMNPAVYYRIRRALGTEFGELPLPASVVSVSAPDAEGRVQLVGEMQVQATPRGRDIEVLTGRASDVVVDRVQTFYERRGEREVVAAFRVSVHNAKDESITLAVNETAPGRWEIVNSTVPAERVNAASFRFLVPVAARSDATLEYRIRIRL